MLWQKKLAKKNFGPEKKLGPKNVKRSNIFGLIFLSGSKKRWVKKFRCSGINDVESGRVTLNFIIPHAYDFPLWIRVG